MTTHREHSRAVEAVRMAGRAGKSANDNPWRSSATLRHLADAWELGRIEGRAERGRKR